MAEVKRKKGETFDALLRRFQRRHQESGRTIEVKRRRFHAKAVNTNRRRESALYRIDKKDKYAYLLKTGQLQEDPKRSQHRRSN
ncbi:30S ribosomal protein S21 [Patescibacteria group bacterium]|nr:30S ribosomal protein S21 [Patescibacteria group bacterium]